MGFGNYVPFERKEPPDPTLGELRDGNFGYTILRLECRNSRFVGPEEARFLCQRLPDGRDAGAMFQMLQVLA